jgi:hypothetical protein
MKSVCVLTVSAGGLSVPPPPPPPPGQPARDSATIASKTMADNPRKSLAQNFIITVLPPEQMK